MPNFARPPPFRWVQVVPYARLSRNLSDLLWVTPLHSNRMDVIGMVPTHSESRNPMSHRRLGVRPGRWPGQPAHPRGPQRRFGSALRRCAEAPYGRQGCRHPLPGSPSRKWHMLLRGLLYFFWEGWHHVVNASLFPIVWAVRFVSLGFNLFLFLGERGCPFEGGNINV